jgi:hypothetical protein
MKHQLLESQVGLIKVRLIPLKKRLIHDNLMTLTCFVLSVLESWSKLPAKIRHGNTYDFGKFEKCLAIHHKSDQAGPILGQHCMFQFFSKSHDTIPVQPDMHAWNSRWKHTDQRFGGAICLPAACSPDDVRTITSLLLMETDFEVVIDFDQNDFCKTASKFDLFSKYSLGAILTFSLLLTFIALSTVYDFAKRKAREHQRNEWFLAFSARRHVTNLFDVKTESKNEVKCLHCLRSLMSIIIVCGHCFSLHMVFPTKNSPNFALPPGFLVLMNFAVNGFFVMSGLLAAKTIVLDLEKYPSFSSC